ncbi:PTS cellobiose transporter subunit IIC [Lactobacillus amylovorus]|uniref:PTS cellobiose transporter subunit IIC n=1 Tax=Lactobacillus amylovorus TaxID=1604 RepID=UPI003F95EAF4
MADKKSGGLVPLCNGTVITWTMPPLISGFLATGSIAGSILQLINIVLDCIRRFDLHAIYVRIEQASTYGRK